MRALLDTCVVVDVLADRQPFSADGQMIFLAAANRQFDGFLTANSLTDIYYLTHKHTHSDDEARQALNRLLILFDLLDTTAPDCRNALLSEMRDFEDAVMAQSALRCNLDCIVTRNLKDFCQSPVPACTPTEFLAQLPAKD